MYKKLYTPKKVDLLNSKKHRFYADEHAEAEIMDQSTLPNYLALYLALVSPLPISVEQAFACVSGKASVPAETPLTSELAAKIRAYYKHSKLNTEKKLSKAEKRFGVNRYKIHKCVHNRYYHSDTSYKTPTTLTEYYQTLI